MNPTMIQNPITGNFGNIQINGADQTIMRYTARGGVSGVVIDPQGKIIPSNFVQTDKMDMIEENKDVPSYLDLASVKVKLNTTDNTITFGQELFGLLPNQTRNLQYWTFVDTDEDKKTGASQAQLANLGVPSSNTTFEGADLVIKSEVNQPFNYQT